MAKKIEINIKTWIDSGLSKISGMFDRAIKRARAFGSAMRAGFHSAPVRLLRNALAALIGTLAAGVMQAAKFNVEMARVWTMSGQGVGWFREMRSEIRGMSGELGVAKEQLAKGLYQTLSAGVPEDNALSFLHTAAQIAVADGSDVATAVDGMSTVLNAFKIDASETEKVADQLFNTVANGKTTFAELAQNLATVAPIAASNGVALNEVLAAVATLTKQGTPTAQAMTQIRAAILSTNEVLGDGWSKAMSLQEAFQKVSDKAGGSQVALRELLGRVEAVQGVLGVTGINARMAADDLDATSAAAGRLDGAFNKVDQFRHWPKIWQSIQGLVERTAQEADSRLAPAVMEMVEAIGRIQDNDDLWAGLGDTIDDALENIQNLYAFIETEGASGLKEIAEDVGLILLGHAKNGSQEAVSLLAKYAPVLGVAFGRAAIDVIAGIGKDKPNSERRSELFKQATDEVGLWSGNHRKRFNELLKEETERNRERRMEAEGKSLQDQVGSGWGDAEIAAGKAGLQSAVIEGSVDRLGKEANTKAQDNLSQIEDDLRRHVIENRRQQSAAYDARRDELLQQAGSAYQGLRGRATAGRYEMANQALYGTQQSMEQAAASVQADEQAAAQIAALANNIKNGTGALQSASMALLQQLITELNGQQAQIEQLRSQIRNGRS